MPDVITLRENSLLTYLFKKYFTRLESDRIFASIHAIFSLVFLSLGFVLRSSYRMDKMIAFGVFFALLSVFYIARTLIGSRPTEPFAASKEHERQIQYIQAILWGAAAAFLLYRGILFALHGHSAGTAIRFLISAGAAAIAVHAYWKARNSC